MNPRTILLIFSILAIAMSMREAGGSYAKHAPGTGIVLEETPERLNVQTSAIKASLRKTGYVSGVEGGTFVDKKTGFHDAGFGLDIVDWLMEPGSDEAYRSRISPQLVYEFNNPLHGQGQKKSVEGPQICTQAKELPLTSIRGHNFAAVTTHYRYTMAAPTKIVGSEWRQTVVFPQGKRWFISTDRVTSANSSDSLFLRVDMPGHIRHNQGDTFSEVYLSYQDGGTIPSSAFMHDFAPDTAYQYIRKGSKKAKRFIRAYHLRDPATGKDGPWLAGMTLDAEAVSEAWCHQRGYVCMIEEIGGRPIRPGQTFGAAYIVGFFDNVDEMNRVYDRYAGTCDIKIDGSGWHAIKKTRL